MTATSKRWFIVTQGGRTVDAVPVSDNVSVAEARQKVEARYPFPQYDASYHTSSHPVTAREISGGWETDGFREHDAAARSRRTA